MEINATIPLPRAGRKSFLSKGSSCRLAKGRLKVFLKGQEGRCVVLTSSNSSKYQSLRSSLKADFLASLGGAEAERVRYEPAESCYPSAVEVSP